LTIEQLKQYRDLKNEIADLEQRIENAVVMDSVQGSDAEFPHILHSVKLEGVPNGDNTYRVQLLEAKLKCKALFNEINDFINSIEDSQLRRIFRYRFVDGLQWEQVTDNIEGYTVYALKKKVYRYLKKCTHLST